MARIEVKEQCKSCFHFQVCANVLKQELFIREKMMREENPKCKQYIPTADVVEVVRCKDCIHYCIEKADGDKFCEILYYASPIESGYCCYGQRKQQREVE